MVINAGRKAAGIACERKPNAIAGYVFLKKIFFVILATSINCLNHQKKNILLFLSTCISIFCNQLFVNSLNNVYFIITADLHKQFRKYDIHMHCLSDENRM